MSAPLRIVAIGSECTGKTTLIRALASRLGLPSSDEYVRDYVDATHRDPVAADVDAIARGQLAAEEQAVGEAVARGAPAVLHDTDLLSTVVYAEHYYGADGAPAWLREAAAARRPDLYLLCEIDVPWVPDPQRNRGDRREEVQSLFRAAVRESGVPAVTITGTGGERERRAAEAVAALLARR